MVAAAADRIPLVCWPGAQVRRYRGRLYAQPPHTVAIRTGEWQTSVERTWALDAARHLELVADTGRGLSQARLPATLRVVTRFDGAQFRPAGAAHRRPLRKWFQDRGVLPWHRDDIPLLCCDDEIVAIADLSCADGYAAGPGEPSWRIHWHGRTPLTQDEALAINWRGTPPFD
jgi:tRNA(Ile)-lysidine synthase